MKASKKLINRLLLSLIGGLICFSANAAVPLIRVDGEPFIILGGELGNSSASSGEDIARIFPKLQRMGLNTVLVPAYWDLMEPIEGSFDFSLTDKVIDEARRNNLRVVFLWFGAWKNSMSCYAPEWAKIDCKRFPRAKTAEGKPMEIFSAFSSSVLDADRKAFEKWLSHIEEYDADGRVIMVQIENEIGMLENARDHSELANKVYSKSVPDALISHLMERDSSALDDEASTPLAKWRSNGKKTTGTWREIFGDDEYADEIFMAWHYANYVEQLAQVAKSISSRPVYVNAALNSRGRRPGEYPSAGPLAHLKDVWHAAAPTIDFMSPDIYDSGFKDWVRQYALADNALFVPEARRCEDNGAQALYIVGEHDALGFSPFSIENGNDEPDARLGKAYDLIKEMTPLIAANRGTGKMRGILLDQDNPRDTIVEGNLRIALSHFFTLPWDPRATDGSVWPSAGGIMIHVSPMEYLVGGTGIVMKFEHLSEHEATATLGEDGFAEAGNGNSQKDLTKEKTRTNGKRIGLLAVDEVSVDAEGGLHYIRRDCGDETHQGRHARISPDDFRILCIRLYEYE